jgi:integrase/recombinase XerD
MSALADHAADYLRLRRTLGSKLTRHGKELAQFVAFCDAAGATTLTTDLAVTWARQPEGVQPVRWAHRLSAVRGFARYLAAIDPATEVPPRDVFPQGHRRPAPYIYSDTDVQQLLDAAAELTPPLHAATTVTVLGLLAASGMRVGETLALFSSDVDLVAGVITIREAKLEKQRLIPLHPSTTAALSAYAELRDRLFPGSKAFFVSSVGTRLAYSALRQTFNLLTAAVGLRTPEQRVRMHDLRHRFAVRVMLDAYRFGVDVPARMTVLSTYLGHSEPKNTYWYLSAVPELMALAAARLDDSQSGTLR